MKRTIKDFSRRQIYDIALEYANSLPKYSGDFFAEKYGISKATFYHILHKAVEESIVSLSDANDIARKAAQNTVEYGGSGASILAYEAYERYIKKRDTFRFSKEEARYWTKAYANSEESAANFAFKNFMQLCTLKYAIYDVVINSWIKYEEIKKAEERLFKNVDDELELALISIKNGGCTDNDRMVVFKNIF